MRNATRSQLTPATGYNFTRSTHHDSQVSKTVFFRQTPTLPFFFQVSQNISCGKFTFQSVRVNPQVTVAFASMFHRKDSPRFLPSRRQSRTKQCVKLGRDWFPFHRSSPLLCDAFDGTAREERYLSK